MPPRPRPAPAEASERGRLTPERGLTTRSSFTTLSRGYRNKSNVKSQPN